MGKGEKKLLILYSFYRMCKASTSLQKIKVSLGCGKVQASSGTRRVSLVRALLSRGERQLAAFRKEAETKPPAASMGTGPVNKVCQLQNLNTDLLLLNIIVDLGAKRSLLSDPRWWSQLSCDILTQHRLVSQWSGDNLLDYLILHYNVNHNHYSILFPKPGG